ncbi:Leucine-rich repeat transmembrane protein kinase, putative [Theobroma cacao]|uniref:non-specific serine/threonine protein kinase n=1 Tax=Theobroma cacao TaxID=3641 RepID=A0A061F990_THECC|nr:Leucine-rich repeat transmembrane protein kinase, putative [Theobroma cacao]
MYRQLGSNNFSGELPTTFARLTTMKDFRIADSNFTGKIPDFIFKNWTKLEKLFIQASGLSGPIPDIALQNLTDLRISDLNGGEATFPQLDLPKLTRLILRSCNLIGQLPDSIGALTKVKILDLSFNRLSGDIPPALSALTDLDNLFLNGNMFTGPVPPWILETKQEMDLSYNNFSLTVPDCQQKGVNLFASTPRITNSGIVPCLRSFKCPAEPLHSLYINCGGRKVPVHGITYEDDSNRAGPSTFVLSSNYWAFSTTGVFLDDAGDRDNLILSNTQVSMSDLELYTTARLSPGSLTYYAFCLKNHSTYNVSLHFAEIQFTDGKTFSSLGRRVFDVYIQGKRELKDFNIKDEAGGVGKPILKNFTVNVTDGTLEIRLHWAGKGSTSVPTRGAYGPLISAISIVDPAYKPSPENGGGMSAGIVVGSVAGAAFAVFLIGGILWWYGFLRPKSTLERDLKGLELQTNSFTLRQIKAATNNFDAANKIGEGGFGPVYKGILADGTVIAVKQLSAKSRQGNREFVTEIGMISALQHPHLVKLYGCCIEGDQLLLIYEYLENNSLARALFGPEEFQLKLDWPTRRRICIGIARGLAHLHEESRLKIVHRDIKATNVLLDKNLNPKISDFGLAKLDEEDNTHISTRIAGTYGYMAPEYAMHGHLTDKADVYSFGIVALEIVSGRCNTQNRSKQESFYLLDWAHVLKEKGSLLDLVDPRIGSDRNIEEVMVMIDVAFLCTNPTAAARPSMSSVVSMLEGNTVVQELITDSSISTKRLNAEAVNKLYQQMNENDEENSQTKSMFGDGPWTTSSSVVDLYPVSLTSDYWKNRDSTN